MNLMTTDMRRFFVMAMRFFFGTWLLYVGLSKWFGTGPAMFVSYITSEFDKTWSPHLLNVALAWLIMLAEPLVAAWILVGKEARRAWSSAALLMFLLTFGQTMLMKPEVADNWQYLVLTLVCAALSEPGNFDAQAEI